MVKNKKAQPGGWKKWWQKNKKFAWLVILYGGLLGVGAVFSYCFLNNNLVLTQNAFYWRVQNWLLENIFAQKWLLVTIYISWVICLWGVFWLIWREIKKGIWGELKWKTILIVLIFLGLPLIVSYNFLSSDIFNYLFNAKMMVRYGADPHVIEPWNMNDPWLQFMHNINTVAPYGYGWTWLSIPLYLLGRDKLLITMWIFKVANLGMWLVTGWAMLKLQKKWRGQADWTSWTLVFLTPIFLLEVIANGHNDIWMLGAGVLSLVLVMKGKNAERRRRKWRQIVLSLVLLVISISIKFATLALIPIWIYLVWGEQIWKWLKGMTIKGTRSTKKLIEKLEQHFNKYLFDYLGLVMFLPLLSARSKTFHPWYLLWPMIWLPLMNWRVGKKLLVVLAMSVLFRYIPYMLTLEYDAITLTWQNLVTWVPLGGTVIWQVVRHFSDRIKR